MKYYRYLFMTFFALSTTAYAFQPKVEIVEQFDNLRMVAFIDMMDIDTNPEWHSALGAPPLTVSGAIKAVNEYIKDSDSAVDISEIELRPLPGDEKHWHYLVKIANDAKKTKYDIYVVLMNGKIVPGIIEPQGYK